MKEFKIFNRWGQLVYDAPVGDVEGWDGKIKNEPAPSDTYVSRGCRPLSSLGAGLQPAEGR